MTFNIDSIISFIEIKNFIQVLENQ